MALRDNQMERSLDQALYKYLPSAWVDSYCKKERLILTAYVTHWNSVPAQGINQERLLWRIGRLVSVFQKHGHTKGFLFPISAKNYEVLTPRQGRAADIYAEISPLVFFCNTCGRVRVYRNTNSVLYSKRRCGRQGCTGELRQLQMVYHCKCGWAGPVKPIGCKKHGTSRLRYDHYAFICDCSPGRRMEMNTICPSCSAWLSPDNAENPGVHIPSSVCMIDLMNSDIEELLSSDVGGASVVLAYGAGAITADDLSKIIRMSGREIDEEGMESEIARIARDFVEQFGIGEALAYRMAEMAIKNSNSSGALKQAKDFVDTNLYQADWGAREELAIEIAEYDAVIRGDVFTLEDAMTAAQSLGMHSLNAASYPETARRLGFRSVRACEDISIVFSAYGFTRRSYNPSEAVLTAFPSETPGMKNVYVNHLTTEGILFELEKAAVLRWLLANGFVDPRRDNIPDLGDELGLQTWFFNYVRLDAITPFMPVSNELYPITAAVYTLIHSASHALIGQAAQLCRLDKNALSEYIFPNIPAFMIYCQNVQGVNLGALFNLFEVYFHRWLSSTIESIQTCIFDPVCIDEEKACVGCLFLNEISCIHFNHDLNRRFLVGWRDKSSGEQVKGFWEGV
ncbi:MAG: DUF1998 domain-containing protein [Firmicutes bacterium]|nr:DUF1998 domain-containing protein [Bacillota bacterium]